MLIAVWDDSTWCTLDDLPETLKRKADDYQLIELPKDCTNGIIAITIYVKGYNHGYYS